MTKKRIQAVLKQVCCILLSIIVIAPFYMVFINSFKDRTGAARMDLALPTEWLFSNYTEVIEQGRLIQGFCNSILYAGVATFIGVVSCSMAALCCAGTGRR